MPKAALALPGRFPVLFQTIKACRFVTDRKASIEPTSWHRAHVGRGRACRLIRRRAAIEIEPSFCVYVNDVTYCLLQISGPYSHRQQAAWENEAAMSRLPIAECIIVNRVPILDVAVA